MIKYPNGKKKNFESAKISTSNRGMNLESELNQTNQYYLDLNLASIHKKPTPITIVQVSYPSRNKAKIIEAYFKTPSTTDYNGVYRSKAIDFEAKECHHKSSFPFSSLHEHQIQHLKNVLAHGAIAFVIIRFNYYQTTYLIKAEDVINLYYKGDRKSIPYSWVCENAYLIREGLIPPLDYLKIIDTLYFEEVNL